MSRPFPTTSFSHEPAEETRWLWTGRIPLAAVTSIQGDGGGGKSTFVRWLAARVSRGELAGDCSDPGTVLWLNVEEHVRRDIRPGLDRQGADVDRIFRPTDRAPILRFPQHLARLGETIIARSARLVVIDQVNAFFANNREDSIRAAMTGLRQIAEECECTVVLTRNLNGSKSADAYRRGRGGGLIVDTSRAAFHLGLHPDDAGSPDGRRVLALVKGNIHGRTSRALELSADSTGRLSIGEEIDLSPSALLQRQQAVREERPEQLEVAIVFLRELLNGREVPTLEIEQAAGERGISQRTLGRARAQLGVLYRRLSTRNSDGSSTQRTMLRLPGFSVPPDPSEPPSTPSARDSDSRGSGRPAPQTSSPSSRHPVTLPASLDDTALRYSLIEMDIDVGRVDRVDKAAPLNGLGATLPTTPAQDGRSP